MAQEISNYNLEITDEGDAHARITFQGEQFDVEITERGITIVAFGDGSTWLGMTQAEWPDVLEILFYAIIEGE
jgi:hypothetical protein